MWVWHMKRIAILGSTGSIGTQTLEIVRNNPDLEVVALAAGNNVELMEKQIREFHPSVVSMQTETAAKDLGSKRGACLLWNGWLIRGGSDSGQPGISDRYCGDDRDKTDRSGHRSRQGYCTCQ